MIHAVIALGSLLAVAGQVSATTRYVAIGGNDSWSNPGTSPSAPLATLDRACWASGPGDEVVVRGGVYYQRASLSCSGTAEAPIRFLPYPGEKVAFDGTGSGADKTLIGVYGSHIDFSGFEVRNATRTGISAYGVTGVRIADNTIHDCELGGIWVGHDEAFRNADITVEGNTVYATAERFYPHTTTSGWPSAINVGSTVGGVVRGNAVYRNHGEGIGIGHSRYVDMTGNTLHDNYSTNLYLDNMQDAVVSGNYVYTLREAPYFRYNAPANGISIANEYSSHAFQDSARIQVINNIVTGARHGLYYGNFQFGTGLHDSVIAHNTVHKAVETGLLIDNAAHSGTTITQNMVSNSKRLATATGPGLTFMRNGWWKGPVGSTAVGAGDVVADPKFVNATPLVAQDLRLQGTSPMANAGVLLPAVFLDFNGQARTAPTSLGAFEAGSSVSGQ